MTSVMERFDDYWSGGDPVTRTRFFIKSIIPMLTIVASYVLFVTTIGPYLMTNRKPIQMRKLMIVYNFSLVAFYVIFLLRGALFIPELGFSLICGSLNESKSPLIPDVFRMGYLLYVIRYIELLDTVFLVLSKKYNMVTPLHVFHHAIVPVFGWFGFRSESSGYLAIFMGLNCIVHVIMYTYYAIAALGPKYQKYIWWKKYLTSLQILQFLVMAIYTNVMYALGCATSRTTFYFALFLTVLFFFLFINYYRRAYKGPSKGGRLPDESHKKNGVKNGMVLANGAEYENNNGSAQSNGISKRNGIPSAYRNATKKSH